MMRPALELGAKCTRSTTDPHKRKARSIAKFKLSLTSAATTLSAMTLRQHALATLSVSFLALHLAMWCVGLVVLEIVRLLVPPTTRSVRRIAARMYHLAVRTDNWWLRRVVGVQWNIPAADVGPGRIAVVISNHRSWSDTLLVQSVICAHGPILKFLAKQELVYVPILGIIVLSFEFPRLKRKASQAQSEEQRRESDRARVTEAALSLRETRAALLSFVEGTRFTEAKRIELNSPFQHLLPPRAGGFSAIVDAVRDHDAVVVDLTLNYEPDVSFWQFIGGVHTHVTIHAASFPADQLPGDLRGWLWQRWEEKEGLLAQGRNLGHPTPTKQHGGALR